MNRKQQQYQQKVVPALQKAFGKDNAMAVAKMEKIVVNIGIGSEPAGKKSVEPIVEQLAQITGQKPRVAPARQSLASFSVREGDPNGVFVTLRGQRMWNFYDKLVTIVLPQLKDFQGVSRTAFDQDGSYSLGLPEQIIFSEIDYDSIDRVRGLQVTITIRNTDSKEESLEMLEQLGMPFAQEQE